MSQKLLLLIFMNCCFFNLGYFFYQELKKIIYLKETLDLIGIKLNMILIIQLLQAALLIIDSKEFENKVYKLSLDF